MGKPYSEELDAFAATYQWAAKADVARLGHFLNRWSGDYTVVVGSGGSYSAAVAVSIFRELAHHSPTVPVTPLEFVSLLKRLSPRALLLSAEGKNRDVLAVARAAARADLASAALTLSHSSPLVDLARNNDALRVFAFQMDWIKDGYLATNSLLATVLLLYRALFGEHDFQHLSQYFEEDRLSNRRRQFSGLVGREDIRRSGLLVIHSPKAKPFAVDLESKLAESALASVQITDLRQFAHGRHIQLALRAPPPFTLVVSARDEQPLAAATTRLLPDPDRTWTLEVHGASDQDVAVTGLIDAMLLTETLAVGASHDPGQPPVPAFGREIYALDMAALLPVEQLPTTRLDLAANRKLASGLHPRGAGRPEMLAAAARFASRLTSSRIKAVVCDFDGTLCRAENRYGGMDADHVEQISSLIRQGLKFAIATGRGDSLHEALRKSFDPALYGDIVVGYYSGSVISGLDEDFRQPITNPDFAALWNWLQSFTHVRIDKPLHDLARGGQFSVRLKNAEQCQRLQAAIRHWLQETGRIGWRAFCSGHSVDVLDERTSKRRVVEWIATTFGIDAMTEVLRLGDAGHEDGNDFELLRDGLSLSCERVSLATDSCWNFGASGSNQADVTIAYLRGLIPSDGAFRFTPSALDAQSDE